MMTPSLFFVLSFAKEQVGTRSCHTTCRCKVRGIPIRHPLDRQHVMNCKEHHLPELELATGQAREALQAILYTILL